MAFNSFCYPCELSIISASILLEEFPKLDVSDVIERIFPSKPESGLLQGEAAMLVGQVLGDMQGRYKHTWVSYQLTGIDKKDTPKR